MRFLLSVLLGLFLSACASGEDGLAGLHSDIVSDYPSVSHISAQKTLMLPDPIYLDIREPEEFAVSHIAGSRLVRPGLSQDEALLAAGDVSGRHIIVYCSVGRRSSIFANEMQSALIEAGALSIRNLETGIFGWQGEGRALINAHGATKFVHPYDAFWKRYVLKPNETAYSVAP